jgi:hypothetical protein
VVVGAAIPGFGLASQRGDIPDPAFSEALAAEEADPDFGLVEPAFLSFRVPKSRSQIPVAVLADWRLFSKEMQFFHRQAENRTARNDTGTFDDVLQFTYIARPHVTHQHGHGL